MLSQPVTTKLINLILTQDLKQENTNETKGNADYEG